MNAAQQVLRATNETEQGLSFSEQGVLMPRHVEFPRPLTWDHDYWLCRCEGFRVDAPTGRLGVVEAVRFGARLDRPDELLVRVGLLRNRTLVVPVSDVQEVAPRQQRLVLRCAPAQGGHDQLARLRAYVGRNARARGRTGERIREADQPRQPE